LHAQSGVAHLMTYAKADATALPFPDQSFDFVVFKSVLGVVGSHNRVERMEQAMQEMQRVLKPGGVLFFAENLQGSYLHRLARHWFVSWGKNWRYLSFLELSALLSGFAGQALHSTGFLSAFVPRPAWLKGLLAQTDRLLFFIPKTWRYVAFGYAVKQSGS
jgi:SAM-dependent methyltransferase